MREAPSFPDARVDALGAGARAGCWRPQRTANARSGSAPPLGRLARPWIPRQQSRLRDEAVRVAADGERCGATLLLLSAIPTIRRRCCTSSIRRRILFVLGDLSRPGAATVAIVGTRRATPYGERVTTRSPARSRPLARCVVSGMARGIDAAAHRAALARGGVTAAVLGTGVDVAYPVGAPVAAPRRSPSAASSSRSSRAASRALPASFPRRNRIIAALAQLTIVVEAGERERRAHHGRSRARPRARRRRRSRADRVAATRWLERSAPERRPPDSRCGDALSLLGLADPAERADVTATLHGDERAIWIALAAGAMPIDLLTERAALTPRRSLAAVTALEIAGLVETLPTGEILPTPVARQGAQRLFFRVPPRHVYVHVPFCARRCSYCDFAIAVRQPRAGRMSTSRRSRVSSSSVR